MEVRGPVTTRLWNDQVSVLISKGQVGEESSELCVHLIQNQVPGTPGIMRTAHVPRVSLCARHLVMQSTQLEPGMSFMKEGLLLSPFLLTEVYLSA